MYIDTIFFCKIRETYLTEYFREVYDDFYKMGMEARRLKNMYGVNGTAILLDSTLSAANPEELPSDGNGPNYVVRNIPPVLWVN